MSGPRSQSKHGGSPLNQLRVAAGLTVEQLAEQFQVSKACVARWLCSARTPPDAFILALQTAATGSTSRLRQRQENWRKRHAPPQIHLTGWLPDGCTIAQARERAADAVGAALARAEGAK